eukprot:m.13188 g.13188  ORF g.13188 m.13188 type:complete len:231 (+) comp9621_c0_seq1:158-850(+)
MEAKVKSRLGSEANFDEKDASGSGKKAKTSSEEKVNVEGVEVSGSAESEEKVVQYLKFYSKSTEGKPLSNFAELKVIVNGHEYLTGEHAFHGEKYYMASDFTCPPDLNRKEQLLQHAKKFQGDNAHLRTPLAAKKAGGKSKLGLELEQPELHQWNETGSGRIQELICKYKYDHHQAVRDVLTSYPTHVLLHQENRANQYTIWGGRIDKKTSTMIGQNKLGDAWMKIRDHP